MQKKRNKEQIHQQAKLGEDFFRQIKNKEFASLPQGPKILNSYTKEFIEVIEAILDEKVSVSSDDKNIIIIGKKQYNLSKILTGTDYTQIYLSDDLVKKCLGFFEKNNTTFEYFRDSPKKALAKVKCILKRDITFEESLSEIEQYAIKRYVDTSDYRRINAAMRSGVSVHVKDILKDPDGKASHFCLDILYAALISNIINNKLEFGNTNKVLYRYTKMDPKRLKQRRNAANKKGVSLEKGFFSTTENISIDTSGFSISWNTKIILKDSRGLYTSSFSKVYEEAGEKENLIVNPQVQWLGYSFDKEQDKHIFVGKIVNIPVEFDENGIWLPSENKIISKLSTCHHMIYKIIKLLTQDIVVLFKKALGFDTTLNNHDIVNDLIEQTSSWHRAMYGLQPAIEYSTKHNDYTPLKLLLENNNFIQQISSLDRAMYGLQPAIEYYVKHNDCTPLKLLLENNNFIQQISPSDRAYYVLQPAIEYSTKYNACTPLKLLLENNEFMGNCDCNYVYYERLFETEVEHSIKDNVHSTIKLLLENNNFIQQISPSDRAYYILKPTVEYSTEYNDYTLLKLLLENNNFIQQISSSDRAYYVLKNAIEYSAQHNNYIGLKLLIESNKFMEKITSSDRAHYGLYSAIVCLKEHCIYTPLKLLLENNDFIKQVSSSDRTLHGLQPAEKYSIENNDSTALNFLLANHNFMKGVHLFNKSRYYSTTQILYDIYTNWLACLYDANNYLSTNNINCDLKLNQNKNTAISHIKPEPEIIL